MKTYKKVNIDNELLRKLAKSPSSGVRIPDALLPGYLWKVFYEYRCGAKYGDILRWEKWHVFGEKPEARPEYTPIELTGGVLLKQGNEAKMVKYRPGLNAAMNACGIFQFYTAPATKIYTDVPTQVLVYAPGVEKPVEVYTPFGTRIDIPTGVSRVVENRFELDGTTTTVVFSSGYLDFKLYLCEKLLAKMEDGWRPDDTNRKNLEAFANGICKYADSLPSIRVWEDDILGNLWDKAINIYNHIKEVR